MRNNKKRVQISFTLNTLEKLDEYSKSTGYSKSMLVDLALKKFLKKGLDNI